MKPQNSNTLAQNGTEIVAAQYVIIQGKVVI